MQALAEPQARPVGARDPILPNLPFDVASSGRDRACLRNGTKTSQLQLSQLTQHINHSIPDVSFAVAYLVV